jgi:hypothetical protein
MSQSSWSRIQVYVHTHTYIEQAHIYTHMHTHEHDMCIYLSNVFHSMKGLNLVHLLPMVASLCGILFLIQLENRNDINSLPWLHSWHMLSFFPCDGYWETWQFTHPQPSVVTWHWLFFIQWSLNSHFLLIILLTQLWQLSIAAGYSIIFLEWNKWWRINICAAQSCPLTAVALLI